MRGHRPSHHSSGATPEAGAVGLLPPDPASLPRIPAPEELEPAQQEALDLLSAGADVVVHAPPRAGRSVLALAAAREHAGRVLLLAPRRGAAARLSDALAAAGIAGSRARTPAGLAFAIVRSAAVARGLGEPSLVTGADQDALLAELIEARSTWHLPLDPATRALPGFRMELRDLLTRAEERGLGPAELDELGRLHDRPAWRDGAVILRDYLGVLDLEAASALDAGPRLDSGALVRRAAGVLAAGEIPPPAQVVVVDDAQDLTLAGIALVAALASAGARILVTSCPDEAVDTFRGAVPDAAARLRAQLSPARRVRSLVLPPRAGTAPGIEQASRVLRGRLPLAGAPSAIRRTAAEPSQPAEPRQPSQGAAPAAGPGGLAALRADGVLEEAHLISSALRELHHREQVPYDDMAVVCRSQGAVAEIADLLARHGLPVRAPHRSRPLREEPVVSDLLTIVEIGRALAARGPEQVAGSMVGSRTALELLRGPFGDADDLRLRRIRRLLRAARPEEPISEDVLVCALLDEEVAGLPPATAGDRASAPIHRLRDMLRAVRDHEGEDAQEVLWSAWEAAELAGGWRRAALGDAQDVDGARARLASSRLDALMSLFAAAERLAERRPGAGPEDLIEQIRGQAVVEDTLAPSAAPRGRLAVLTPAQLAGEDRDTVVLARVQEGAWPNLRLRSTLLGAADLDMVEEIAGTGDADALQAARRAQVLADELRLAVAAMSRARTRVLVTAVEDADLAPSALFEVLSALEQPAWTDLESLRADPGPAPDIRRVVAALRRRLHEQDPQRAQDAALALSVLGESGAPGTRAEQWYHQEPSSEDPLAREDAPIPLSPSALERAHDCPRAWLFERAGGTRTSGAPQQVGTALHRIAQDHPEPGTPVEDLLEQLHTLLRGVPGLETWSGRRRVRRAEDAVRLLAEHLASAAGRALAVEAPFTVDLPPVRLRGTIDRIEGDQGGLRVVDLKTGRVPKSAAAAAEDLQLAAYQAAVREGALDELLGEDAPDRLQGAELVYIGTGARKAAVRTQGALGEAEDPRWFDELVAQVASEVSGPRVIARINSHCSRCAVRSSCPLQPEGAQL